MDFPWNPDTWEVAKDSSPTLGYSSLSIEYLVMSTEEGYFLGSQYNSVFVSILYPSCYRPRMQFCYGLKVQRGFLWVDSFCNGVVCIVLVLSITHRGLVAISFLVWRGAFYVGMSWGGASEWWKNWQTISSHDIFGFGNSFYEFIYLVHFYINQCFLFMGRYFCRPPIRFRSGSQGHNGPAMLAFSFPWFASMPRQRGFPQRVGTALRQEEQQRQNEGSHSSSDNAANRETEEDVAIFPAHSQEHVIVPTTLDSLESQL